MAIGIIILKCITKIIGPRFALYVQIMMNFGKDLRIILAAEGARDALNRLNPQDFPKAKKCIRFGVE